MIKLLTDIGSNKSGEIVKFSKRKENELVMKGFAIHLKTEDQCYNLK
jgi:hypothetical protein